MATFFDCKPHIFATQYKYRYYYGFYKRKGVAPIHKIIIANIGGNVFNLCLHNC